MRRRLLGQEDVLLPRGHFLGDELVVDTLYYMLSYSEKVHGKIYFQHIVCYFHTANAAFISYNKLSSYEEDNSETHFILIYETENIVI